MASSSDPSSSSSPQTTTTPWTAMRIVPSSAAGARDAVVTALFDNGSQGIHEDGDAIVTHFPPGAPIDVITYAVAAADPSAVITTSETPPVQWDEWRARVGVHTVGALTIAPPWLADTLDPDIRATTIVIDPAMAFGTGEHPTTRGVLRLAQQIIRTGDVVADLGAGSAVLSIAAAKLGASRVVAIELDPDATTNAEENIARNGVADRVRYIEGDAAVLLPLVAPVRVVLANIISSVLLPLLPTIADALTPDGQAILSGLLYHERDTMLSAFSTGGWTVVAEDVEHEDVEGAWWSVAIAKAAV